MQAAVPSSKINSALYPGSYTDVSKHVLQICTLSTLSLYLSEICVCDQYVM